jgi:hypothetical protein
MSRKALPNSYPNLPRIITDYHIGHWSAWFENSPQVAYGGDTPGTATDRLWAAWEEERFREAAYRAVDGDL